MSMAARSPIHDMPLELVTRILEHLQQRDLRVVSRASRHLYRLAQDAGRHIFRTIYFSTVDDYKPQLAMFKMVVKYALSRPPTERPGVALRFVCVCGEDARVAFTPGLVLILDAITDSLPMLVSLEAYVPPFFCEALYDALRQPAPRLRYLALGQAKDPVASALPPPAGLFNGHARRLHSVCLVLPTLPADWTPPTVFQRVTCAHVQLYRAIHPAPLSRILPRLRSLGLDLQFNKSRRAEGPEINLSGLPLEHLKLCGRPYAPSLISGVDFRRVRVVEHVAKRVFDAANWSAEDASSTAHLCARILYEEYFDIGSVHVGVAPITGAWTRTSDVCLKEGESLLLPLSTIPNVNTRLVALMLDQRFLQPFLLCDSDMPGLLDLYIDVTRHKLSNPAWDIERLAVRVCCPVLQAVTLLSFGDEVPLRADKVAVLGQKLGLRMRAETPRAVLKLARVSFVQPATRRRVEQAFSAIEEYPNVDPEVLRLSDACSSHVPRNWAARA
ncbi:hypothetical protein AURDEDRAFT_163758 [Auricularia subglabra TFB-10046 SS5]|nr:hypothetical protein AURDEDRAFT_163758 [Auricularia subglabra TFB-10046 SS5]